MTDISKCNGKDCPIKDKCWRFTAPADIMQSYMDFQYDNNECSDYWDNKGRV